jgi:hypothetical protein
MENSTNSAIIPHKTLFFDMIFTFYFLLIIQNFILRSARNDLVSHLKSHYLQEIAGQARNDVEANISHNFPP